MQVTEIPFVKLVGIEEEELTLSLKTKESTHNHLGTLHAGAIYTLAETQSGLYLQTTFSELENRVVPLLRTSSIKYKKPATSTVSAYAYTSEEVVHTFRTQFDKKSRALIQVHVDIKDEENLLLAEATFDWFVQKID